MPAPALPKHALPAPGERPRGPSAACAPRACAEAAGEDGRPPLILFGAFDRHNLGDLLLGRIAAALAARLAPGRPLLWAGLAERDLRAAGGARVRRLDAIADRIRHRHRLQPARPAPDLLQVGGEILGCGAWEAAVMLARPAQAEALIAAHDRDLGGRDAWARHHLGIARHLPYLAPTTLFPPGLRIAHAGSGGVGFAHLPAAWREEAIAALRGAAVLHVRDRDSRRALAAAGIDARLAPDPAVLVARVLGSEIAREAERGAAARVSARFPGGWIAAQLGAEFGDDLSLAALAAALDRLQRDTGWGVVLFCAGRAPWHDAPEVLHRLRARLQAPGHCIVATTRHVLQLCALIAGARLCLASSLHARIVAEAFARPAASLVQGSAQGEKVRAYVRSWHRHAAHLGVLDTPPASAVVHAAHEALAEPAAARDRRAARLAARAEVAARRCFAALARD